MATSFSLDSRADKNGDQPIRVILSIKGEKFTTSAGYSINPEKWDKPNQVVKKGCSNSKGITYSVINSHLKNIDAFFTKYEADLTLNPETETTSLNKLFADNFRRTKNTPQTEISFFNRFDEFMAEMGKENDWTIATTNKFHSIKNHLLKFDPLLSFGKMDNNGLHKYVEFLRKIQIGGKKTKEKDTRLFGMRNSTIGKELGFVKWFLRWATAKGYNQQTEFIQFKPKLKTTDSKVIFLDWKELMTVYNFDFSKAKKEVSGVISELTSENAHALERVRDVFCFCCFTSLRYSDVANLKRTSVFDDFIQITTVKTADSLTIELNDFSKSILKKYENEKFLKNLALPVISNQRMNEHLKELGKVCGIDTPVTLTYYKGNKRFDEVFPKYELLGTHAGRRTFICNALSMGIAPQVVMKWTGHSDYKAMKPYIDIADSVKVDAMKLFNQKS